MASGARRYCARGPLALERLHAPGGIEALTSPDARLVYRLPEPDMHGRQELRLTPHELLDRRARLVPPPRIHRHRYHGVLARIYQVIPLLCPACDGEMKIKGVALSTRRSVRLVLKRYSLSSTLIPKSLGALPGSCKREREYNLLRGDIMCRAQDPLRRRVNGAKFCRIGSLPAVSCSV